MVKAIATTIWCAAILVGGYHIAKKARELSYWHYQLLDTPPLTSVDSRYLDLLTLGARPVYDDIVAIWATQIIVDPHIGNFYTDDIYKTLELMSRHQPKSPGFYTASCWYLGLTRNKPEYCEPILLQGMAALPQNWQIPAMQGFMAGFKLQDFEKAAVYLNIASSIPGAPAYFKGAAKKLGDKAGVNIDVLNETFNILRDDPNSGIGELVDQLLKGSQTGGEK